MAGSSQSFLMQSSAQCRNMDHRSALRVFAATIRDNS
jgi:hypothetical protein